MTNRLDLPDPMQFPDADRSTGYARAPLRILTCGSVDAGKSTLIGRLLRDGRTSAPRDGGAGLAAPVATLDDERPHASGCEGAHHAFASPNRCFTIVEAPGHDNDIHDFAAAAATSDLAILLIDARWGPCVQTRRLAHIVALLGIREVILAVNKIDLVDHSQAMFDRIVGEFVDVAARLGFRHIQPIPISARDGDTVRRHSGKTPWYDGPTVLGHLERLEAGNESAPHFRFAVQGVDRPGSDRPGLSGKVVSGAVRAGDEVVAAASGKAALIARIVGAVGDQPEARAGEAVALVLDRETEIASGDILAPPRDRPGLTDQFAAHILWLDRDPLLPSRQYILRIGDISTPASVTTIKHRVDLDSLDHAAARTLERNEIGFCNLSTARRVALDPFARNRATGRFHLIDRFTDRIAGFGLVSYSLFRADNIHPESFLVDKAARSALNRQVPIVLWFTGLSGSGKSTIAKLVEQRLHLQGKRTFSLDGDNVRHGLNRDLGFSDADRVENIRRIGEVAKLFTEAGLIVICSFISPFRAERRMARGLLAAGEFVEIFVDTPIEECIRRDPKGLYAKAKRGEIRNFTGMDSPYETPEEPELRIETVGRSAEESVDQVLAWLARREA